jgi:hypothetical protein
MSVRCGLALRHVGMRHRRSFCAVKEFSEGRTRSTLSAAGRGAESVRPTNPGQVQAGFRALFAPALPRRRMKLKYPRGGDGGAGFRDSVWKHRENCGGGWQSTAPMD